MERCAGHARRIESRASSLERAPTEDTAERPHHLCSINRGLSIHQIEPITVDAVKETLCDPVLITRFAEVFRQEVECRLAAHSEPYSEP